LVEHVDLVDEDITPYEDRVFLLKDRERNGPTSRIPFGSCL
jgi:hypothetical protein